jgi:glycosyltransferase involved in cell wall biosynthesis
MKPGFQDRVGLQQRVLPHYRQPFFDRLAQDCGGGLSVFAGQPRPDEAILTTERLHHAQYWPARNIHRFSGALFLCSQPNIVEWLNATQPGALILEANPRYLSNRRALTWMSNQGKPVLGWGLGASPPKGPLTPVRRMARWSYYRRFDAMIAYSSQGAEQFAAYGVPRQSIFVALNSVAPAPTRAPNRPPILDRPTRILFVGRLQPRKRVDLLLQACQALEHPLEIRIVGDGPAREEWSQLATEILPQTEFTGAQTGTDLENHYRWADLFVLPGTGGLAVQEAMSYGLPVIVAQGDGTQRDLVNPDTGWLVKPGSLQSLQSALETAISQPARLAEMGRASFEFVVQHANIDAMAQVFVRALNYTSREV